MAIYDCFSFFNELDLLKIRLEMMYDIVDKFVIVEMNKTYRGIDKPYNFLLHKNDYKKYLDKIIYINPDNIPEYKGEGDWEIEHYSRNSIMKGLINIDPEDIVIVSDLDEIPNPDIFIHPNNYSFSRFPDRSKRAIFKIYTSNKNCWSFKPFKNWMDILEYSPISLQQTLYYYFFNCRCTKKWYGTVICKYKNLITTQNLRSRRGEIPYIKDAGWHCSYFGGLETVKEKFKAVIDNRTIVMNTADKCSTDEEYIKECMRNNKDIYNGDTPFEYIPFKKISFPHKEKILETYPHFFNN